MMHTLWSMPKDSHLEFSSEISYEKQGTKKPRQTWFFSEKHYIISALF